MQNLLPIQITIHPMQTNRIAYTRFSDNYSVLTTKRKHNTSLTATSSPVCTLTPKCTKQSHYTKFSEINLPNINNAEED